MSINVEILGGGLMVQHYIEEIGQPDHLRLVSNSDVFTPTGRTKIGVIRDLSVRTIDDKRMSSQIRLTALPRRNSWTSSASKEYRGRFSRLLVSRFQRLRDK
jgi:hypothetical protein